MGGTTARFPLLTMCVVGFQAPTLHEADKSSFEKRMINKTTTYSIPWHRKWYLLEPISSGSSFATIRIEMFCLLTKLFRIFSVILSLCPISPTRALLRTIGPVGDPRFQRAVAACDGANPKKLEFGVCSELVDCIYDNVDEAFKASLSSGTNIASLLPTILVLIGELGFS